MIAQDAIIDELLALLQAAIPAARVEADIDFDAMRDSELQAVEVQMAASAADYTYAGPTAPRNWLTRLRISCAARADAAAPISGRPSSALLAAVDAAISADPLLGDLLTRELRLEEMRPDHSQGATAVGVMQALYSCEHQTAWNSLTS